MYLDVADAANLPYGWSRYAQFSLAVVNQIHTRYTIRKGTYNLLVMFILNMEPECMHEDIVPVLEEADHLFIFEYAHGFTMLSLPEREE